MCTQPEEQTVQSHRTLCLLYYCSSVSYFIEFHDRKLPKTIPFCTNQAISSTHFRNYFYLKDTILQRMKLYYKAFSRLLKNKTLYLLLTWDQQITIHVDKHTSPEQRHFVMGDVKSWTRADEYHPRSLLYSPEHRSSGHPLGMTSCRLVTTSRHSGGKKPKQLTLRTPLGSLLITLNKRNT